MAASRWGDRSALFARRAAAKRQNIARFAARMADDMTITDAAEAIGVSQQTGSIYFRQICSELGPQATGPRDATYDPDTWDRLK